MTKGYDESGEPETTRGVPAQRSNTMTGFTLPEHSPLWARLLGLRIDWQSRPTDRTRTYHSANRRVEVTVGLHGIRFAVEKTSYEEHTLLHLEVPGFALFARVGRGREVPAGEMAISWGASIHEGDLVLDWGARRARFTLNPFRWHGYRSESLISDGSWNDTPRWRPEAAALDWYTEEHPYAIASLPSTKMAIETWRATATCYVERTTRTRRFLPFWRRVEHWVYFDLSDEIGETTGSWKGGTVGFSEEMLPGDSVQDVVQRAARKGRGR